MRRFLLNVILVLAIVLFLRYVHYSLEPEPSNQPDTYSNFSSLAENESPADYDISYNEKKHPGGNNGAIQNKRHAHTGARRRPL